MILIIFTEFGEEFECQWPYKTGKEDDDKIPHAMSDAVSTE